MLVPIIEDQTLSFQDLMSFPTRILQMPSGSGTINPRW